MQRKFFGLAALCVALVSVPVSAHHSHNAYEVTKWTTMEGTVTEIHYLLPHSWVYMEIKDPKGGEPTVWALEAAGPMAMTRNGVKKEDVKPGDKISVRCHSAPGWLAWLPARIPDPQHWRSGARQRRRTPGGIREEILNPKSQIPNFIIQPPDFPSFLSALGKL
jgi:hypothetical protein